VSYQSVLLTELIVTAAEIGLAIVAARVVVATLLALAARLARGRPSAARLHGAALRMSPRFARGGVAALVGTALVLGSSTTATASPEKPSAAARAAFVPVLDRVVEPVATGGSISWRDEQRPDRPQRKDRRERTTEAETSAGTHVVQPGESLWSIAADSLGERASDARIARSWPRWHRANLAVIGADPSRLVPGMTLRVPGPR
jgi:nucleoid-associated protein YgaU